MTKKNSGPPPTPLTEFSGSTQHGLNALAWSRGTVYYPHVFLKSKGDIVIASVRLSVRLSVSPSVRYAISSLTNQIWCVNYSHAWGVQRQFLCAAPWGFRRGQKVKYHLISITKSISKIFLYHALCVF